MVRSLIILLLISNAFAIDRFELSAPESQSQSHSASKKFWFYSQDNESLIDKDFKFKGDFFYEISFWFDLFATFRSSTIIFHDSNNLKVIYDIFSADTLYNKDINKFTKDAISQEMVKSRMDQMNNAFDALISGGKETQLTKQILTVLSENKIKIPDNKKMRRNFFKGLKDNLRYQMGQRNRVIDALSNMYPYLSSIDSILRKFKMPQDLKSISILESSFNYKAKSSVGATGVWQIMETVGKAFLVINKFEDQRLNPIISSLASFRLLKKNFDYLGNWDFTVISYNSGISHILKYQKKSKVLNVRDYLLNYDHDNFGFASRNYIFEFYALNYALAYKKYLYPEVFNLNFPSDGEFNIYVSLCDFLIDKSQIPNFKLWNPQFLDGRVRRGSSIISKDNLDKEKFYKISDKEIANLLPNQFSKLISNYKCSIK